MNKVHVYKLFVQISYNCNIGLPCKVGLSVMRAKREHVKQVMRYNHNK